MTADKVHLDLPQRSFARALASAVSRFSDQVSRERELWVVALAALLTFIPGIGWGLPHATHPLTVHGWDLDAIAGLPTLVEIHHLFVAPQPDWYVAYPPLHYLVLGIFYIPYVAFLYLTGGISGSSSVYPFGFQDPVAALEHFALIGRAVTVLMATGVVVNCYLTARTIWDKPTARFAAAAVALPTPIFYNARVGTLDIPLLFWESLVILMIARCLAMGFTNRRAALVGVFAAFAVTTKDQAFGPLFLGLLALVAVYLWQNKADLSAIRTWKFPFVLGLCGSIAFVFASGLVISPHRFIGHFVYIRNYEQNFYGITARFGQPATLYGYSVLTWEVLTELFFSIGPVFLAVGIAGLLLTLRTGPFTRILCAMLVGHLVFVVWAVRYTQFRYIILTTYIFSFFIGRALAVSIQDERPRWLVPVALSCAIAGYGWLGLRCVNLTYQMYFDSRYQAGKWLDQNSRPGDELAFFTSQNVLPPINADIQLLKLFADPAPMDKVLGNSPRYILGQPDFASPIGSDRSYFFPDSVYNELGNLGYTATAKFETPPLFERFFLNDTLVGPGYYVNPPITVFEKTK